MITRRRLLRILAGTAALPLATKIASAQTRQWRGIALGANAQIILDHPDAENLIAKALGEINRLEKVFSLARPDSQLSVLNRDGYLPNPSFDLIELLSVCSVINRRTGGAFDPTIQPLWALYAGKYAAGEKPRIDEIVRTRERVGWQYVAFSTDQIKFQRKAMALTLNGIAQGFIADRVSRLLRNNGVSNVLVNTGEIAATGIAPDGQPWQVKLDNRDGRSISLTNAAIATSAPLGTAFDRAETIGHILDPRTGKPGSSWSNISVMAQSAAVADGLSTAFCLMQKTQIMAALGDERVWLG